MQLDMMTTEKVCKQDCGPEYMQGSQSGPLFLDQLRMKQISRARKSI